MRLRLRRSLCQGSGRGIRKIREAGIEVTVGVLEAECLELNKRFITFNTHQRPYIILKWAQTANGFLDNGGRGMAISSPFTKMLSHKLRAENDAILIGRVTDERDHSQLNVRDWSGKDRCAWSSTAIILVSKVWISHGARRKCCSKSCSTYIIIRCSR